MNELPIGAIVMILHDVTDLGMSVFKMTSDITPFVIQVLGYILMVVPWIYFRMWFFNFHLIGKIFDEIWTSHHPVLRDTVAFSTGFLICLSCMHIYWFYLMINGFFRRMKNINSISVSSSENT